MNELQIVFDKLNIDFEKILQAARTKWNFLNFYPGLVGGHCIGVDPYYLSYLANKNKLKTKIINLSRRINNSMSEYHANVISRKLKRQKMKKILILGFAFKENCSDFRNTGVFGLYSSLRSKSFKTDVYDPLVNAVSVKKYYQVTLIKKITKKYDCIIIAVKHNLFKKIKIRKHLKEKSNFIYDIKKIWFTKMIKRHFPKLLFFISITIFFYTIFKSEIYWEGKLRDYYFKYYLFSFILILFFFNNFSFK